MTTHGLTSVSAGPIFTSRTINVTISKAFPITLSGLRIFVENAGAKYINATPMSSGTNCCFAITANTLAGDTQILCP